MKFKKFAKKTLLFPLWLMLGIPGESGEEGEQTEADNIKIVDEKEVEKKEVKTYTQQEVEKLIEKRLIRERKTAKEQREEEIKKANMTENEKLKAEKEESEKKAQEKINIANQRLIKSEVYLEAAKLKIIDADAAFSLMNKENIEIDDDGKIKGIKESLDLLIKEKTWIVKNENEVKEIKTGAAPKETKKTFDFNSLIRNAAGFGDKK